MSDHKPAPAPFDLPAYVQARLSELREWCNQEQRGYTRSAYDAQIEELERLQDEAGWPTTPVITLAAQQQENARYENARIRAYRAMRITEPNFDQYNGASRVYSAAFETTEPPSDAEVELASLRADRDSHQRVAIQAMADRDRLAGEVAAVREAQSRRESYLLSLGAEGLPAERLMAMQTQRWQEQEITRQLENRFFALRTAAQALVEKFDRSPNLDDRRSYAEPELSALKARLEDR